MSESMPEVLEIEPVMIAGALESWLLEEINTSGSGRLAELDDWDAFQRDITLPFDSHLNQNANKAKKHHRRLDDWTRSALNYGGLLASDRFFAQQSYSAKEFMSGAFRVQCFMQSSSRDEYLENRFERGPIGINLQETVSEQLNDMANKPPESEKELLEATIERNDTALERAKNIAPYLRDEQGKKLSASVEVIKESQKLWGGLAVRYIVFGARERNSIEAVPFLEAKSISEGPQVYYPFAPQAA